MPKKLEELRLIWLNTKFRFANTGGDVLIGDCATSLDDYLGPTVKVTEEDEHPVANGTYRFYGSWTETKYGRQFVAKTFIECTPIGKAGVIAYLKRAPHIGHAIAHDLWSKFADKAVQILREQPDVAAAASKHLKQEKAEEASQYLEERRALEQCTIEVIDLLEGHGFPKGLPKALVRGYGNRAAQEIRDSPYIVMGYRGCGFKRADALYLALGGDPASMLRQRLCAWYAVASNRNGDTWHYSEVAKRGLLSAIGGAEVEESEAVRLACFHGDLAANWTNGIAGAPDWDGDCMWLATGPNANNERRLAEYVCDAVNDGSCEWPEVPQGELSAHQYEVLQKTLDTPLAILGGSPGTGKTYTAAHLIKYLIQHYSAQEIGMCCPTGKAAVRLNQALATYGLPIRARTVHSMLKVDSTSGESWSFVHGPNDPLPYKVILVDEVSMLDTSLACSLMSARMDGTLVYLVGDVNQLLPVGHGAPLRDLTAAGVTYGELSEIRRNSGAIVECCNNIRLGNGPIYESGGNLTLLESHEPNDQIDRMLETIMTCGKNPVWDCQVICAVNQNSDLAKTKLNEVLQRHLNRNPPISGSPFRLGDKVVNTQNSWLTQADRWISENRNRFNDMVKQLDLNDIDGDDGQNEKGQWYVANGELGTVLDVQPKFMVVALTSPLRIVMAPRGGQDEDDGGDEESSGSGGSSWELGYALSCHKCQGSEFPIVVTMIDGSGSASRICDRSWIYTAVSRAREHCYMIGKRQVLESMCQKVNISKRKTFLRELLAASLSRM